MDKALRYLALASKAGLLRVGAEDCAEALGKRKGCLLVLAEDAAGNTVRQAEKLAGETDVLLHRSAYAKSELARCVGKGSAVALALVCDRGLAEAFVNAAEKQ